MTDQQRFTISVPSTHPTPWGDIHHTVHGKLTSPTPTLQETGSTVLSPIREDEAMWMKRLA